MRVLVWDRIGIILRESQIEKNTELKQHGMLLVCAHQGNDSEPGGLHSIFCCISCGVICHGGCNLLDLTARLHAYGSNMGGSAGEALNSRVRGAAQEIPTSCPSSTA